jgi:hypothetical protein
MKNRCSYHKNHSCVNVCVRKCLSNKMYPGVYIYISLSIYLSIHLSIYLESPYNPLCKHRKHHPDLFLKHDIQFKSLFSFFYAICLVVTCAYYIFYTCGCSRIYLLREYDCAMFWVSF